MITIVRKLLRAEQWYKNLVIFLPILFVERPYTYPLSYLLLGCFGLCTISSASYILNDWRDRAKDRLHPTKKMRPLASGKVSGRQALSIAILLCAITGMIALALGSTYGIIVLAYIVSSTLYSFGLKDIPLLDILLITGNFVLRTMAGLRDMPPTDDLLLFVLLAVCILIFLSHKRRSDRKILGRSTTHKPVLAFYTPERCYAIRAISYAVGLVALTMLWIRGEVTIVSAILLSALLVLTSVLLSRKPDLAIKPHYLLRIWFWDVLLLLILFLLAW